MSYTEDIENQMLNQMFVMKTDFAKDAGSDGFCAMDIDYVNDEEDEEDAYDEEEVQDVYNDDVPMEELNDDV
jgi:hypothetical protein